MLSLVAFSLNESIAAATIDESNTVTQLKLVSSRQQLQKFVRREVAWAVVAKLSDPKFFFRRSGWCEGGTLGIPGNGSGRLGLEPGAFFWSASLRRRESWNRMLKNKSPLEQIFSIKKTWLDRRIDGVDEKPQFKSRSAKRSLINVTLGTWLILKYIKAYWVATFLDLRNRFSAKMLH